MAALLVLGAGLLILTGALPGPVTAQDASPDGPARVSYTNEVDGTVLTAGLHLPEGPGPHPGVVLLSIAGTGPLVERLVADGRAVLTPERRGFVDVEPMLRASYADLAGDVGAAVDFLVAHPAVDGRRVAVVAQADDAPPALLAATLGTRALPLVLLAPPAFDGVEEFRRDQRLAAERERWPSSELELLDTYVRRIAEIVRSDAAPYVREYRLQNLRAGSPVQLPRSAAFPADERQAHFFASPLWHDRLSFDPVAAMAEVKAPTLILVGSEDPGVGAEEVVDAVRRARERSGSDALRVCVLPGRTRHVFSEPAVDAISAWLRGDPVRCPGTL